MFIINRKNGDSQLSRIIELNIQESKWVEIAGFKFCGKRLTFYKNTDVKDSGYNDFSLSDAVSTVQRLSIRHHREGPVVVLLCLQATVL